MIRNAQPGDRVVLPDGRQAKVVGKIRDDFYQKWEVSVRPLGQGSGTYPTLVFRPGQLKPIENG